jgi:hypothetical protein
VDAGVSPRAARIRPTPRSRDGHAPVSPVAGAAPHAWWVDVAMTGPGRLCPGSPGSLPWGVLFFVTLSVLAAATVGSVVVYQRGERRRIAGAPAPAPRLTAGTTPPGRRAAPPTGDDGSGDEPTLETLAPGDVVVDGVDDWLVVGSVAYREEGDTWAMHLLDGGQRHRLLEVRRRRGDVEVAFLDVVDDLPRGQLLGGLNHRGQAFQLEGRGDARTTTKGDCGEHLSRGGALEWARYGAAGGGLLLVEDEGPRRRGFVGQRVPPSSLSFMSGALNRGDGEGDDGVDPGDDG